MQRDNAVALLKERLQRSNDSALTTKIVTELQATQERLEGAPRLPWFLLTTDSTLTFTAADETLAVPADFLREFEEGGALFVRNTGGDPVLWTPLRKDSDYDAIYQRYGEETGLPKRYVLEGLTFKVKPTPDLTYSARLKYYAKDDTLDTNIENLWLRYASDLVIAETGFVIAERYLRDAEMAQAMAQDAITARRRLSISDDARLQAGLDVAMGDD